MGEAGPRIPRTASARRALNVHRVSRAARRACNEGGGMRRWAANRRQSREGSAQAMDDSEATPGAKGAGWA